MTNFSPHQSCSGLPQNTDWTVEGRSIIITSTIIAVLCQESRSVPKDIKQPLYHGVYTSSLCCIFVYSEIKISCLHSCSTCSLAQVGLELEITSPSMARAAGTTVQTCDNQPSLELSFFWPLINWWNDCMAGKDLPSQTCTESQACFQHNLPSHSGHGSISHGQGVPCTAQVAAGATPLELFPNWAPFLCYSISPWS